MQVDASSKHELNDAVSTTIIIVSWNTLDLTLDCLRSLHETTSLASVEVILVDNASTDGTAGEVIRRFPSTRVLASPKNVGFGRAVNLAASHARGKFILLLNSDTIVLPGAIEALLAFAQANPGAGIWGGGTLFANGSVNRSSCWQLPTLWSIFCNAFALARLFPRSVFFNGESFGGWPRNSSREVGMVSGCFCLISRDLFCRLDGFDPVFFMYGEDADLCSRARSLGARPHFTPQAQIVHLGRQSDGSANISTYLLGARIELARRLLSPFSARLAAAIVVAGVALRVLALELLSVLSRNPDQRKRARDWRVTWTRRRLWIHGALQEPLPVCSERCRS